MPPMTVWPVSSSSLTVKVGSSSARRWIAVPSFSWSAFDFGSMALKEAVQKAKPVLLEPMMAVEVITPEEYMGEVIGDINSRRGQVNSMEDRTGVKAVKALVPLSEMFGYVGDLRSKTQGRANYTMIFDSYAEVPSSVAQEIISERTGN